MNDIINVNGVKCYEQDGTAYLNLEAVARGLGFTTTQKIDGKEYINVRWQRVDEYLREMNFATSGKRPEFIPENIFYRLAMKAKNETAEKFQALIADEVIPSIRKHGAYMTPEKLQEVLLSPDTLIQLAINLKDEQEKNKRLTAKVEQDAPKVLFADSVACSNSEILVGELAKILKQNGMDIGQNRLFERLRQDGYLVRRKGTDYNMPTQRSMEMGLMRVKETSITHADGHVSVSRTPKVTGKGQIYFVNRYARTV